MLLKADGLISCREVPFLGLIMAPELGQLHGCSTRLVCNHCVLYLCSMHCLLAKFPHPDGRRSMKKKNTGHHEGYPLWVFSGP